jgi:membrane protein
MALTPLAKKLSRTLARVIPQCGMVAQAVAFNMFLAFFAVLLTALSLMKSSFEGEGGQGVAMRISAILPPGSWQLISAYVLRQEVKAWYLALIGWVGTLLVGSQVIKLIIKGIELIHGDHDTHSFLGAPDSWFAFVFLSKCGVARCRCAECLWSAIRAVDYCRILQLFVGS